MFKKQTLLILGAGASHPYDFPLGDGLVEKIIQCIKNDNVFFPYTSQNSHKIINNELFELTNYNAIIEENKKSHFLQFIRTKAIKNPTKLHEIICRNNILNYVIQPEHMIDNKIYKLNGIEAVRIKLSCIKELHELANMLEDFHPVSIDAFLRDHPEHKIAGQTMIIYCLLNYHNNVKFKNDLSNKNHDNWYRYLLNDIKSGCQNSHDLLKNNLSIETFNYDVSIDYYLKHKLMNTSFFKDHASEYLAKLKINHIYGSICDIEKIDEFYDIRSSQFSELENELINFHHLLYGYGESVSDIPRIKQIGERDVSSETAEKIKNADTIIFIGFSFDRDNLTTLGFPMDHYKYSQFFLSRSSGGIPLVKKILYLDYEGRMNGLHDEFKELSNFVNRDYQLNPKLIIQRSIATSISNAYVNDFKSKLFS